MPWADVIAGAVILILATAACGNPLRGRHRSPWERMFDHAPDRPRAEAWPEIWGYSHDTGGPLPRRRSPDRRRKTG